MSSSRRNVPIKVPSPSQEPRPATHEHAQGEGGWDARMPRARVPTSSRSGADPGVATRRGTRRGEVPEWYRRLVGCAELMETSARCVKVCRAARILAWAL